MVTVAEFIDRMIEIAKTEQLPDAQNETVSEHVPMTYRQAWNNTLDQVLSQIPELTDHLDGARLIRVYEGVFHVALTSQQAKSVCEGRMHREIKNRLKWIIDFEPVLRFSVRQPIPKRNDAIPTIQRLHQLAAS